jgi:hypothetical protein
MSKTRYALAVIVLIGLVAIFNYAINMDPTQLAARGVGHDPHDHGHEDEHEHEEHAEAAKPPDFIGPQDAPVSLEVFYETDNECMTEFEPLMAKISERYAPHVRIEFKPTSVAENMERTHELRLGCRSGIAINGEVAKKIPGVGPFDVVSFQGPPGQKDYDETMLYRAIEYEMKQKGVEFEPSAPELEPSETAGNG